MPVFKMENIEWWTFGDRGRFTLLHFCPSNSPTVYERNGVSTKDWKCQRCGKICPMLERIRFLTNLPLSLNM